jgi:hypothetical protein
MPNRIPSFRAAAPVETFIQQLGPLGELPGNWRGRGFNLIARPDFQGGSELFLELNPTDEELHFSSIGGPIPNRGAVQDDIEIFGLHYLQQISDRSSGGAIHLEPGIWLNVPSTTEPVEPATVVRMATIPHGTAVLIQGSSFSVPGGPRITPANTVPFKIGDQPPPQGTPNGFPEYNLSAPNNFRTTPTPASITQAMVTDPNSVLVNDIKDQTITETIVLDISTATGTVPNAFGGAEDIPFLGPNADVAQVSAIFWIEKVKYPAPYDDHLFLQLQYTQTVLLNFDGLSWPHVSVATLRKVT